MQVGLLCRRVRTLAILLALAAPASHAVPRRSLNAAELQLAIEGLNVLGSALYLAAHPDDENTALLTYLAKERGVRTAYLSVTRGDGGQNLIGTENGVAMGVLRTQELLAARRLEGVEQYFTRAVDFGYSKSAEETLEIWGKQAVLADVVWVVRNLRPDVIITRFPGDGRGRHGQHTASTILAVEAFEAAADRARFPEQLDTVEPWQAKRILWNHWRPDLENRDPELPPLLAIDLGAYNPLLGKSYREIAALSRSMHKSQGFGVAAGRGSRLDYLEHLAGEPARADLFEGIDLTWRRVPGGSEMEAVFRQLLASYRPDDPTAVIPSLLAARQRLLKLPHHPWVARKTRELEEILLAAGGVWIEAVAAEEAVAPGGSLTVNASVVNRSEFPFRLEDIGLPFESRPHTVAEELEPNLPFTLEAQVSIPAEQALTQPYWLRQPWEKGRFAAAERTLVGLPEAPSPLTLGFRLAAGGQHLLFQEEVVFRWTDPVDGERWRSVEIVPPLALNLDQEVLVFPDAEPRTIRLVAQAGAAVARGVVRLQVPQGWAASPSEIPVEPLAIGDERVLRFTVIPPAHSASGRLRVEAEVGDGRLWTVGVRSIRYSHIPTQTFFPAAEAELVRLELKRRGEELGYVMGAGDGIPEALRQLGYRVTLISDGELEEIDLDRFDAIVLGVRAFNTRQRLAQQKRRLLEYVHSGGTLVVQYNTAHSRVTEELGPFPFKISRSRVSVEEAPVTLTAPEHPLLQQPNRITAADFENWVQERGLYFPDEWDPRYQTVLASHDPGEPELRGGILYAEYGDGIYIYTSLSFFRQLPAGVPGAYRLFANLISAGSSDAR